MIKWLDDLAGELHKGNRCILVTVLTVEGSAPREPGARMIVTDTCLHGTIGGGQLEFEALETAREQLAQPPGAWMRRFPLGPELGQCCGGVVTVLFEPYSGADAAWIDQLRRRALAATAAVRIVDVKPDGTFVRVVVQSETEIPTSDDPWVLARARQLFETSTEGFQVRLHDGGGTLVEALVDNRQPVFLFGAGHVGRAVARALAPLPFRITWIDSRANAFPDELPDGVFRLVVEPVYLVGEAPPGTFYLVMTHSHALDQQLCEAVLRRLDSAYLGLIGSATKAARFASRLKARMFEDELVARIHCPIGLPGIAGKQPDVIAASVAADLLIRLEQTRTDHDIDAKIGSSLNV